MNNKKQINKRSPFAAGVIGVVFTVLALQMTVVASAQTLVGITNQTWRYFATTGGDPGVGWQNVGFDDSTWLTGRGLFGNDTGYPYPFVSTFAGPSTGGPLVSFYRTTFSWASSPNGVVLTMTNYVDDGDVIYLNGTEITRFNMPAGPADQTTVAVAALTEPIRVIHQIALDSLTNGNLNPLINGNNVLAVSVHNNGAGSSDTVFGLSVVGSQSIAPCTDLIQPTNRTILVGRTTTFTVVEQCAIPAATIQWYRNVGAGEELITGATGASYSLSNAVAGDAGAYYARLANSKGTVDSRQAVLTVNSDMTAPQFVLASVVGPGLNTFRLTTDEQLCGVAGDCGSDFTFQFNWQINQSDNTSIDLGVATITMITPTVYEFTTSNPRDASKQYQITVTPVFGEISDLFSNFVPPGTFAETLPQASFQQGDANAYAGTQDTELHSNANADVPLGANAVINVDNDDTGVAQALLKFGGIFGPGPGQIPASATIINATLTINQTDPGSDINFHRMLLDWDQATATWNSMNNGLTADDIEAVAASDALKTGTIANGLLSLNVTASVQAWANGAPNYGWAIISTGGDGWRWNAQESGASTAPLLTVEYRVGVCSGLPTITAQPPAAVSANELQPFSITVGVSNACGTLQWTKNGADIPGANSLTYSVASAGPSDAGTYRLRATNPAGSVTSAGAVVTFVPKTSHPHVTRVGSSANGTTITVTFNEAVSTASAQNTANYTLTPSVAVSSAVLGANNTVTLTTAARNVGTAYSLRIANVTDIAATPNAIDPNPTVVNLTSASIVAGTEWNSTWLYNSNNLDSTSGAWKDTGFTPGADWGTGPALFGAETGAALTAGPAPIGTPLTPNSVAATSEQLVTTYFRKTITLPALPAGGRYVICHYTDDGFIAYLDGAEIYRFAMPAGAVTFTNRSTGIPTGDATYRSFSFTAAAGAHTLAVELHQAGVTTSDVLFGMEVHVVGGAAPSLSISHAAGGPVNLSWNADGNWRLRGSAGVTGPYTDVAIPAANPLGTFSLPSGSVTNRNFWLLDYVCPP